MFIFYQRRSGSGAAAAFNVGVHVANEPRFVNINVILFCRLENQCGLRLAAGALVFRSMKAIEEFFDRRAAELSQKLIVDGAERFHRRLSFRGIGLIRDDENEPSVFCREVERFAYAGQQLELRCLERRAPLALAKHQRVENTVAVEEKSAVHLKRFKNGRM